MLQLRRIRLHHPWRIPGPEEVAKRLLRFLRTGHLRGCYGKHQQGFFLLGLFRRREIHFDLVRRWSRFPAKGRPLTSCSRPWIRASSCPRPRIRTPRCPSSPLHSHWSWLLTKKIRNMNFCWYRQLYQCFLCYCIRWMWCKLKNIIENEVFFSRQHEMNEILKMGLGKHSCLIILIEKAAVFYFFVIALFIF